MEKKVKFVLLLGWSIILVNLVVLISLGLSEFTDKNDPATQFLFICLSITIIYVLKQQITERKG
jgi:hypothetical protein